MAKILRKQQKIFGGNLAAPNNIARFGSLAAGAPAYSLDPSDIQSLAAYLNGWAAALVNAPGGNASPAMQDFNALFYLLTYQMGYVLQDGIPEWDAGTPYYINSFCKSGGVVYISKTDANTGNLVTDTNNWKTLASTLITDSAQARAWVCFNGVSGAIYSSLNVASITKTATGCYILNFTNNLPNAFYAFAGTAGVPSGSAFGPGDDNIITGGWSGRASVKTVSQLSIFCSDPQDRQLQDSQAISVQIFGG